MTDLTRRAILSASLAAGGVAVADWLSGCTPESPQPPRPTSPSERSPDTAATPPQEAASRILLVFFSRAGENYWEGGRRDLEVGNTKVLAEMIGERVACDIYEIVAADPYPEAYDPTVERNVEEQNTDDRPAIARELPDTSGYDTVLIGSPVWNMQAPMIMSTFIEKVDLKGKTILPFVTYAVSGMSGVDDDYGTALPDSTVATGLAIRGEDVPDAAEDLDNWLETNQLAGR
ncbi:flavodoxin [Actinopolymorpha sp. B17G11]|uniref:flavodoxin n=1 Tax=unclassified Actinopolymorpha TaxID=2627063 RepID=UPI0032D93E51